MSFWDHVTIEEYMKDPQAAKALRKQRIADGVPKLDPPPEPEDLPLPALLIESGHWITWKQFQQDCLDFAINMREENYDAVIGVPRSGMLPATIFSIQNGTKLFCCSDYGPLDLGGGYRSTRLNQEVRKALLLEDSAASGGSIRKAYKSIKDTGINWEIHRASIYATEQSMKYLDRYHTHLDLPHWFEWNLLGNMHLIQSFSLATDLDGILCRDFTLEEDDDGERYINAMRNMACLLPRSINLPLIVTARLEKYRKETQKWLEDNQCSCTRLVMGPWESKEERERSDIAAWKLGVCNDYRIRMFVESDPYIAKRMANTKGVVILCPALEGSVHGI